MGKSLGAIGEAGRGGRVLGMMLARGLGAAAGAGGTVVFGFVALTGAEFSGRGLVPEYAVAGGTVLEPEVTAGCQSAPRSA